MDSLWKKAAEFLYNRRKDKRWRTIVTCLAAVVVFVTTYALILPAITMDDETAEQEPGVVLVQDEAAAEAAIAEAEPAEAQVSEEEVPIESEGSDEEEAIVIDSDDGADGADPDAEEADIQLIDVTANESTEPMTKTYQDDEIEITATYSAEANIPEEAEFRVTKLAVEETAEAEEAVAEESEEIEAADAAEVTERYRYDIGFYVGEEEIEPEDTVSLSVRFLAGQFAETEEITAVHYLDDNDPSNTETIQPKVNEDQAGNVQAEFDMDSFSVVEFQGINAASEDTQAESEENNTELQTEDAPTVFANAGAGTFTLTYQGIFQSSVITVHCVDATGASIPNSNVTDYSTSRSDQTYTFADIRPDIEGYQYQNAHWGSISGTEITSVTTAYEGSWYDPTYGWKTSVSDDLNTSGDVYLIYQEDNQEDDGKRTVTFDANGGSGDAPAAQTVPVGEQITFPEPDSLTKAGYTFVGWSTDQDANESGVAHNRSPVYSAGSEYTVEEDQTFYAIWGQNSAPGTFYIALDGSIRNEPRTTTDNDNASWTYGAEITGAIKVAKFYNNQTGVEDNLNKTPSNEQLAGMINNAINRGKTIQVNNGDGTKETISGAVVVDGELYAAKDATGSGESTGEKLYVRWYVVKNVGGGTVLYVDGEELTNPYAKNPNSEWHIDGVLQKEGKVLLMYEVNAPASTYDQMPDGSSYTPGTTGVKAGNHNGNNSNLIEPARNDGYVFAGWRMYTPDEDGNLKYNSDGTVTGIDQGIYQTGDTFTITENTLLVAQWVKDKANLTVKKTDMDGHVIDTATFKLNETEKSTTNGVADFGSIELNTIYELSETVAPTGYERRMNTIYFAETKNGSTYSVKYYSDAAGSTEIDAPDWIESSFTGSNLTLTIKDEPIQYPVQFIKEDSESSALAGAVFELKDSDDVVVDILQTSGSDGVFSKDNATLTYGTYTLTEKTAPNGYEKINDPITLTVSDNGIISDASDVTCGTKTSADNTTVYTVTVKDTYAPEITILKVATGGGTDENPQYLSGAEFDLFASKLEGNETVIDESKKLNTDAYVSNDDGAFSLGSLREGVYFLKETKAPDGYKLLAEPIRITVTNNKVTVNGTSGANPEDVQPNDDCTYTITVSNSTGQELPHTGGSGTTLFTFGGLAILAGCLMAGYSMRRKRERRSE